MRSKAYCKYAVIFILHLTQIMAIPTSTQDSLVVVDTAANENTQTNVTDTIEATPKITSMHVESNVSMRYANTLVTSKVSNAAAKANEVTFSIVLPETAFITGFSMEIDGKIYEAYVKEKEEAKKVYDAAISSGQAAAHVAVQARDSNHFTVSVNLEPASKAIFRLRYEELLVKRLGLFNHVINLNPGQVIDELSVDVNIEENSIISILHVPELRTGNEIDALPTDANNPYSTSKISEDRLHATVKFSPNKEQQLELMKTFMERKNERSTPAPIPFYPFNVKPDNKIEEGISGQFVVQYEVELDANGQILVNDGHFVHFFAPKNLTPLKKHAIFVLDVSGSMYGKKMSQLKEAMTSILEELKPGDYFNIIEFSYNAKVYSLDSDKEHVLYAPTGRDYFYHQQNLSSMETIPPHAKLATPENIKKAKDLIKQLMADGGTNINDAITVALKVAKYGIEEKEDLQATPSPDKVKHQPMIIFLTDGDATVGETNSDKIMSNVKNLNDKKVAIFSLAFGEDADRNFLRKLSLRNSGFMRHIYEAADAAQQLQQFYNQISSPLLADVTYIYPENQVDEASVTKTLFNHYFLGSELIVAGKLMNTDVLNTQIKVVGQSEMGPIDFIPTIINIPKNTKFYPLERLWSYLAIKQLLDDKDLQNETEAKATTKKALDIAMKYSFVTPLTSLVVVKPNATSAVNAESVPIGQRGGIPLASYALPLTIGGAIPQDPVMGMPAIQFSANKYPALAGGGAFSSSYAPVKMVGLSGPSMISDPVAYYPPAPKPVSTPAFPLYPFPEMERVQDFDSEPDSLPEGFKSTTIQSLDINKLEKYGLSAYDWLEKYVSVNESIEIPLKDEKITSLKLKLLSDVNGDSLEEQPCNNTVNGGSGFCQYLTDCKDLQDGFKDLITYTNHYCDAHGFAGICCKRKTTTKTT